ncbi:MAG: proteasome assembly chaperone family protein [Candidatus Hadarchaeaceae archaeon]
MVKEPSAAEVEIVEVKDLGMKNPLIITGFVGAGLVGSIAIDQIINKLKMEEVAYVKSKYLPPVAIFVGERLRHPFRIHASKKDNLCAVICEIPLRDEGLYSVSSALLDWAEKQGTKEILVLEGIPVPGLPTDRRPFCVTEEDKCNYFKDRGINMLRKGVIYGIAGAILSECLTRKIEGTAILTPAMATIPDPEGAAVLIDALNKAYGLKIDTSELIAGANEIREKLKEIAEKYEKTTTEPEKMYA